MDKFGLVVTSINKGEFLKGYCEQAEREGKKSEVVFYVIADKKSPPDLYVQCEYFTRQGFAVECIGGDEFLKKVGMANLVPWNSDNRRNIGYLMALKDGCTKIISIDDDNYCLPGTYFSEHSVVGREITLPIVDDGWYNVCKHITIHAHPRGFPLYPKKLAKRVELEELRKIAVNAGLWLGSPDVDAYAWLAKPDMWSYYFVGSVGLGRNAWCPINSQNTAVSREAMAAYYYIPTGATVNGLTIDRYGDIFQGYFLAACVKHMNEGIRFGTPLVDHKRNSHNYLQDARQELAGLYMLEEFCDWITEVKLTGTDYTTLYLSLADALEDAVESFAGWIWTPDAKAYFHRIAYAMRKWSAAYVNVGGAS